ncbi:hypothetical protein [Sphingobium sp. Z007]|uniref:hypothetical protein n=2 Tax=Sphingobium sp. Z007 TaxID=627495 RepID=UPI0020CF8165|nr:hypothetical protein [Sphingobium sp. Z007]
MIDGAPEVDHLAVDLHVHLVKVPASTAKPPHPADPLPADVASEQRTEPVPPQAHCLMTDVDTPFEQQVFYVSERQRIADKATLIGETVTIASIDPDIKPSVRLGYMQNEQQVAIRAYHLPAADRVLSMREFVDKGFEHEVLGDFLELVEKPVRRYRLVLPKTPQMFSIFSGDEMLRDELERMLFLDVNHFGS